MAEQPQTQLTIHSSSTAQSEDGGSLGFDQTAVEPIFGMGWCCHPKILNVGIRAGIIGPKFGADLKLMWTISELAGYFRRRRVDWSWNVRGFVHRIQAIHEIARAHEINGVRLLVHVNLRRVGCGPRH
jgi:hypothetical protein